MKGRATIDPRLTDLKPEAFLFDLDGTLIDSEMLWARAIVGWLADYGVAASSGDILSSPSSRALYHPCLRMKSR